MKFQKYMFGCDVDNQSVAKYVNDDDSIALVLESEGEKVNKSINMHFDSQQEFEDYLDSFISDEQGMEGEAKGLKLLIDRFEFESNKDSEYSERHRQKRQAKRLPLDFYLDDDFECSIYDQLQTVDNRKQTILAALDEYFKNKA